MINKHIHDVNIGRQHIFQEYVIIIIKLYFDTIKSGTPVPFTGVYRHISR